MSWLNYRSIAVAKEWMKKWAASWQNQQSECAPSEDSDQPGHPPSLIRVFAVRMKKPWALATHWAHSEDSDQPGHLPSLWSDWADAQADLSLRWADAQADLNLHWVHTHFVGFVMSWLKYERDSDDTKTKLYEFMWSWQQNCSSLIDATVVGMASHRYICTDLFKPHWPRHEKTCLWGLRPG